MTEFGFAFRLLAACCVVGGLLALFRYAALALASGGARGLRARGSARLVAVTETAHLPGGASLHVVRAGERQFVVGRSAACIAMLCELRPDAPGGAPPAREA